MQKCYLQFFILIKMNFINKDSFFPSVSYLLKSKKISKHRDLSFQSSDWLHVLCSFSPQYGSSQVDTVLIFPSPTLTHFVYNQSSHKGDPHVFLTHQSCRKKHTRSSHISLFRSAKKYGNFENLMNNWLSFPFSQDISEVSHVVLYRYFTQYCQEILPNNRIIQM